MSFRGTKRDPLSPKEALEETLRAWQGIEALRFITGKAEFVSGWFVSGELDRPMPPRSYEDAWAHRAHTRIRENVQLEPPSAPPEVGTWIVGEVSAWETLHPKIEHAPLPVGKDMVDMLDDFVKIDTDDPHKRHKAASRFFNRYGPLGTGMALWDPATHGHGQDQPVRYALGEPLALWRIEARAVKKLRDVREIAEQPSSAEAERLASRFGRYAEWLQEVTPEEQALMDSRAWALVRVHCAFNDHARLQDVDVRIGARRAYVSVINDALRQRARYYITDTPHKAVTKIAGAYGLLYFALAAELRFAPARRICEAEGCSELIPASKRHGTRFCGTKACRKRRQRAYKRARIQAEHEI